MQCITTGYHFIKELLVRILVAVIILFSAVSFAQTKEKTKTYPMYQDIGILGLHTHDLADFDSFDDLDAQKTLGVAEQREDGRANLSTIFLNEEVYKKDFRDIGMGGHKKNTNQAGIFNYSQTLVNLYQNQIAAGVQENDARKWVVKHFLEDVRRSYVRVTGKSFPSKAICDPLNELDLIPLLLFHDLIPGILAETVVEGYLKKPMMSSPIPLFEIKTAQDSLNLTIDDNDGRMLSYSQMNEFIPEFDGKYDPRILAKKAFPIGYIFRESAKKDKEGGWKKMTATPIPGAPEMGTLADLDRLFITLILERNREEIETYKTYNQYLGLDANSIVETLKAATYPTLLKEHADKSFDQTTTAKMFEVTMAKSLCPDEWMPAIACVGDHITSDLCLN